MKSKILTKDQIESVIEEAVSKVHAGDPEQKTLDWARSQM